MKKNKNRKNNLHYLSKFSETIFLLIVSIYFFLGSPINSNFHKGNIASKHMTIAQAESFTISLGVTGTTFSLYAESICKSGNPVVNLSWEANSEANSYDLYKNDELFSSNINENEFSDALVNSNKTYTYYVVLNRTNSKENSYPITITVDKCSSEKKTINEITNENENVNRNENQNININTNSYYNYNSNIVANDSNNNLNNNGYYDNGSIEEKNNANKNKNKNENVAVDMQIGSKNENKENRNINYFITKTKDTVENFNKLQEKIPEPAKAGVVTTSAGIQLLWMFTFFDSFKDLWFTLLRIAQSFLVFIGLRARKGKNWGVVYDWNTKEPLKNVAISLVDERGENMGAMITDESGRFGFLVDEGKYFLKVQPSKDYEFKPESYDLEDLYGKVYKGEELFIQNEILLKLNVPLVSKIPVENRKLNLSWLNFTKIKSSKIVSVLLEISFWIGFIFVTIPLFNGVTNLKLAIFLFYLFMLLIRIYLLYVIRQWGLVVFEENKNPIPFAVIRAFKKTENGTEQSGISVSNTKGGFYMLVPPDTYDLSIKGRSIDGTNFSKEMNVKINKGVINGVYKI